MIDQNVNLLVVSAHTADFVWRAGGTIAKYVKHGANVALVILPESCTDIREIR